MKTCNLVIFIFGLISFNSCLTTKSKQTLPEIKIFSPAENLKYNLNCIQSDTFSIVEFYNCYKDSLLNYSDQNLYNKLYKEYDKFYLLEVTTSIFLSDSILKDEADEYLYMFFTSIFNYIKNEKPYLSPMHSMNIKELKYTLENWNSKKCFEICVAYLSKNRHDSMGHGDCTNLGVRFFEEIILPKIKSIDGMDFWTYYNKNTKDVNYGPLDCYDSFYEAVYPLLKQAWEDGKIELKDVQINE